MLTPLMPTDSFVLRLAIAGCCLAIILCAALLTIDRRVLDDELIWLKPMKFHLSLAIHAITVLVAVRMLPNDWQSHLLTKATLAIFACVVIYEALFLSIQAGRGVRSHFNSDTSFDAIGGTLMAAGASILVIVPIGVGVALAIASGRGGLAGIGANPLPFAMALGLLLSGWLGAQTGSAIGANAGPFVNVDPDAERFVPLTGWSMSGGDYRISHFLGIHAMQAVPLAVVIMMIVLPTALAAVLTLPFAAGWTALTLFTLSRAANGLPPL